MSGLLVNDLIKSYKSKIVVNSVSLRVKNGEVVGLLGPNGAGKTTTFYMIFGLVKPDKGSVYLDNHDITNYPTYLRAIKGLGYLPQDPSIFSKLTVEDNIMIILQSLYPNNIDRHKIKVHKLLNELGILKLANIPARLLSGGERRRLEIARTLAVNPKVILLDEPFAGVDPIAILDIIQIIKHLKNRKIGILISDHNVRDTLGVCDTAFILNEGRVIVKGTPQEIINNETAQKFYLGKDFKL